MTIESCQQRTYSILHTFVTDFSMAGLLGEVSAGVTVRDRRVIAHHNLHSIFLFHRCPLFRAFYETQVHSSPIDGMPLIWIARLYGHIISRACRLTYVDFLPLMLAMASESRWRIFYLGSRPDACAKGTEIVRTRYPGIVWRSHSGYFDVTTSGATNRQIVSEIALFQPDILMVGMGMPRQEHWIAANLDTLAAGVVLPCGAAIDYIAGAIPTPPRWAGRVGLEWFYRLCAEPRRLAPRYLLEPWALLAILIRDLMPGSRHHRGQ